MARFSLSTGPYLAWVLLICPAIGFFVSVIWVGDTDPDIWSASLLFGLPAVLSVLAGVLGGQSAMAIGLGALGSSMIAGLALWVTYVWIGSEGGFQ